MPFNLGFGELLLVGFVALLVFGGKLPDVAQRVGGVLSDFRRGMKDELRELERDVEAPPPDWAPPPDGEDCEGLT